MRFVLPIILIILVAGCPHPLPSPESSETSIPDAGYDTSADSFTSVYDAACYNMSKLECAEGKANNCATTLERAVKEKITNFRLACLAFAKSKEEIRNCGNVKCL